MQSRLGEPPGRTVLKPKGISSTHSKLLSKRGFLCGCMFLPLSPSSPFLHKVNASPKWRRRERRARSQVRFFRRLALKPLHVQRTPLHTLFLSLPFLVFLLFPDLPSHHGVVVWTHSHHMLTPTMGVRE